MVGTINQLNPETNKFEKFYPRTYGYLIKGTVNDSDKLNGKPSSSYMPSTFSSYMEIKGEDKKYKGLICSKLVVGNSNKITTLADNQCWITGKLYVQNGEEVATKADLNTLLKDVDSKIASNVEISKHSLTCDKLATPFHINGVECDGSQDINIPTVAVQPTEPTTNKSIWINPIDGNFYYYYKNNWKQLGTTSTGNITNVTQTFVISNTAPIDNTKLWINPQDSIISYYYNNKWVQIGVVTNGDDVTLSSL